MGDHVNIDSKSAGTKDDWDTEASINPWGLSGSCENLHCNDLDDYFIKKVNSEVINWMVEEYWDIVPREKRKPRIDIINKKAGLFVGDALQKHAALHKVSEILAKSYYKEERIYAETCCRKFCSTLTFDELRQFNDAFFVKQFEEVNFYTPKSKLIWLEEKELLKESIDNAFLQRIAFLTKTEESWLKKVFTQQYEYFEMFTMMAIGGDGCHWIKLDKKDDFLLELIGYIVYKKPCQLAKYSEEELEKIKPIAEQIRSKICTDDIKLSCIFLMYLSKGREIVEPVFRIRNPQDILFVDINHRVYSNWNDFETSNKLPECVYFYPYKGEYNKTEGLHITFSWSPASSASKKVVGVLDVVGKVVTIGSAAALGAAAALHTLPMVAVGGAAAAVASGAYGINRGISKIMDKVSHQQSVDTHDVINVLSNVVSVATGGVARAVPALAAVRSSVLFTHSAIQGLSAITTLVPEDQSDTFAPVSGELPLKTLLFFNSKSPHQVIEKIKETYDLAPDKSNFFAIKTFVLANSVESTCMGRIQKYISKSLASLVMELLDAAKENKNDLEDTLIIRNIFNLCEFPSLEFAFTKASDRERVEFFKLLLNNVFVISSLCVTSVPLRGYKGVQFHPVSKLFETIDFGVICKGIFTVDDYLDAKTCKKLHVSVDKILTVICSGNENKDNGSMSLSQYCDLIKTKWNEILSVFEIK